MTALGELKGKTLDLVYQLEAIDLPSVLGQVLGWRAAAGTSKEGSRLVGPLLLTASSSFWVCGARPQPHRLGFGIQWGLRWRGGGTVRGHSRVHTCGYACGVGLCVCPERKLLSEIYSFQINATMEDSGSYKSQLMGMAKSKGNKCILVRINTQSCNE